MNRLVCYKKKIQLFLEEERYFDAFISTACELSQQVEPLFGEGRKLINIILECRYYLTMLMNIYIKIRFRSSICIPKVLGNL